MTLTPGDAQSETEASGASVTKLVFVVILDFVRSTLERSTLSIVSVPSLFFEG